MFSKASEPVSEAYQPLPRDEVVTAIKPVYLLFSLLKGSGCFVHLCFIIPNCYVVVTVHEAVRKGVQNIWLIS